MRFRIERRDLLRAALLAAQLHPGVAARRLADLERARPRGSAPRSRRRSGGRSGASPRRPCCAGLVTAWRLAIWPTSRSPPWFAATIDGVVRLPSLFAITTGSPRSRIATQLFVVPRSMPTTLPISSIRASGRVDSRRPSPTRSRPRPWPAGAAGPSAVALLVDLDDGARAWSLVGRTRRTASCTWGSNGLPCASISTTPKRRQDLQRASDR